MSPRTLNYVLDSGIHPYAIEMTIRHRHYGDYELRGSAPYQHAVGAEDLNKSLELDVPTKSDSWHNVQIYRLVAWARNDTLRKTAFAKLRISLASDDLSPEASIALVKTVFDKKTSDALERRGYMRKLFAACGVFWQKAWSEDKPEEYEIFTGSQTEYGVHLTRALENEQNICKAGRDKVQFTSSASSRRSALASSPKGKRRASKMT